MGSIKEVLHMDSVALSADEKNVVIIDQTKLPNALEYMSLGTASDIYDAMHELKVRGALAVSICAAYGMYVLASTITADDSETFLAEYGRLSEYLGSARPAIVNLKYALKRMESVATANREKTKDEIVALLGTESKAIHTQTGKICELISEYGLTLLKEGDGILTHCNAGPLSSTGYGTALGPILLGKERGIRFRVFADETRPLLQGARLTSYELEKAGVDVILICDSMAGVVMKNGWINACFVNADKVALNGDTVGKIGTSGLAVLAAYYRIPFYVLTPMSTFDTGCRAGEDIVIEMRDPNEIKEKFYKQPMTLKEAKCYNPAFDVTEHDLITAFVTEKGICRPPFDLNIAALLEK